MAIYPCGETTGVYYLIVSGLPWSATWQKLKDFIRYPTNGDPINVEHVFIYPNATDGWVKINGKEDFQRAYECLNGRTFEGKALVADDRNGYTMINLRDMAPIQTGLTSQRERVGNTRSSPETYYSAASPAEYTTTPQYHEAADSYETYPTVENSYHKQLAHYSPAPPIPPSSSGQSSYGTNYNTSSVSYNAHMPYDYSFATPQTVYLTSAAPIHVLPVQQYPTHLIPLGPLVPSPSPTQFHHPAPTLAVEARHQFVQEARKIIITHLPLSITEKELESLLERACQRSHKSKSQAPISEHPIEHFELLKESNGKVRGHAFATFFSATIAQRAVDNLDGKVYQRRELKARLTKEGVESVGRASLDHQYVAASVSPAREQSVYSESSYNPSEISTQMSNMSLTPNTVYSGVEPKREKREKSARRDADSKRDRGRERRGRSSHHSTRTLSVPEIERDRSSSTKSAASVRAPMVVDGSSRRRHR